MSGSFLERAALELAQALEPLAQATSSLDHAVDLIEAIGWEPPEQVTDLGLDQLPVRAVLELAGDLLALSAEDRSKVDVVAPKVAALLGAIVELTTKLATAAESLRSNPQLDPDYLVATQIGEQLVERLLSYLVVRHMQSTHTSLFNMLTLAGIFRLEHMSEDPAEHRTEHVRAHIAFELLPAARADGWMTAAYGWGTHDLDAVRFLGNAAQALSQLAGGARGSHMSEALESLLLGRPVPEAATDPLPMFVVPVLRDLWGDGTEIVVNLATLRETAPGATDRGFAVIPSARGNVHTDISLPGTKLVLHVEAGATLDGSLALLVRPGQVPVLRTDLGTPATTTTSFEARAELEYQADDPPPSLEFAPGIGTLSLAGASAGVAVHLDSSGATPEMTLAVSGVTVTLTFSGGDSFVQNLTPSTSDASATIDVRAVLDRGRLRVTGAAGGEIVVPLSISVAGIALLMLRIRLRYKDGKIDLAAGLDAAGSLGPFAVALSDIGARATLCMSPGNLGPVHVDVAFKPPTGVGVAIDLPAVSGGGFLLLDPEAGQYAGVFELTIIGTVSVKAIAIITTKLPGGQDGFALLVIITAEGFTPVPLGFGFSLTGVGGLLALNRSVAVDVVRNGLRDGVLDSVLFVKDPVKNAPRIISTLNRVFPLAPDRLVVGPLAEITWGTPPLVKIRLALLLEVPDPVKIALIAQVAVSLPTEKAAVVEIHVDAIGVLDFSRGELSLDASIHHSRLLCLTLSGDLAFRLNWASDPGFVMSVGGFHPKYRLPSGLRQLNRLSLSLTGSNNPRIKLETYLAITSNSIQMGARVQLYAEAAGFGIDGGGAFDALIQWAPFYIDVSFEAWVRIFSSAGTLFAARVAVEVTGPEPWHVTGLVEIHILFVAITVGVDFELGESRARTPVETVDVAALLWDEVSQPGSWQATLPRGVDPGATLAVPAPSDDDLVIHPLSELAGRQRVVPLDTTITRMGARRPAAGPSAYALRVTAPVGVAVDPVSELFAPAQFTESTEDAKLSGPAFVPLHAGVRLRSEHAAGLPVDGIVSSTMEVETLNVDELDQPAVRGPKVEVTAPDRPAAASGRASSARNLATMGAVLTS